MSIYEIKRIKCCGRMTQLYKSKRMQYCHKCHYQYNYEGENTGYFGSGKTKTEWGRWAKNL